MPSNHRITVSLDLLRRLAEHTREAAKMHDQMGQVQGSVDAEATAREADDVAVRAVDAGVLDG